MTNSKLNDMPFTKRMGRPDKCSHIIKALDSKTLYTSGMIAELAEAKKLNPFDEVLEKGELARTRIRTAMGDRAMYHFFPDQGDDKVQPLGRQRSYPGWYGFRWKETLDEELSMPLHDLAGYFLTQFDETGMGLLENAEPGLVKLMAMVADTQAGGQSRVMEILVKLAHPILETIDDGLEKFICEGLFSMSQFWGERILAIKYARKMEQAVCDITKAMGRRAEPRDLLRVLATQSAANWRNLITWEALNSFGTMVCPEQVLSEIEADRESRDLARWLHLSGNYLGHLDWALSAGSYSSGLALLQAAQQYHKKFIYADVFCKLQDTAEEGGWS